jgi:acyl-CoA reductase-like NAD-dependent aldehyde dehydrogenase
MMVERARWAVGAFSRLDQEQTLRIAHAAAEAGFARARYYGEEELHETGFGVAAHKQVQNELSTRGVVQYYSDDLLVGTRSNPAGKSVSVARPAGVVLALIPSTNPVSIALFKVICALMTRNAIIVSPHPSAISCAVSAVRLLASAAIRAGAPDGAIQVLDEPSWGLNEAIMRDPGVDVILATGGASLLQAAYRSGNPTIGAGPGNVPVLVDSTADLARSAKRIAESKAFDNSLLSASESVLIVEDAIAERLLERLKSEGGHLCTAADAVRLRQCLFPAGAFEKAATGKSAAWIAERAGIRVKPDTKVLLAPFDLAVPEEPLCHEKLCAVLGFCRVRDAEAGIDVARAVLRCAGGGHSAAIHSRDPATIMAFASALKALRIVANGPCVTQVAGSNVVGAPSVVIATGFCGHGVLGQSLGPHHLVHWSRIAYSDDTAESLGYHGEPVCTRARSASQCFCQRA